MYLLLYSGWVVPGPFGFENCVTYLYMKTKVKITNKFCLQGVGGFFYTEVIMSRNRMQTYEIIPYYNVHVHSRNDM